MRTRILGFGIFLGATLLLHAATNDISAALQRGLFEEEGNRNFDAAAQAYQSAIGQFDKDRQFAATAIFRLGEIYRKQGRTNEANAQYDRIVREFGDQAALVTLSQQNLTALRAQTAASKSQQFRADRSEQKKLLDEQIKLAEQDFEEAKKAQENGVVSGTEVRAKYNEVLRLRLQLASLDSGAEGSAAGSLSTDEEEKEIRRIRAMIQNSPDLINAPGSDGSMPLHDAADKAQPTVARFLLENGANPNVGNKQNWTPLHKAAAAGHKAMVELLLGKGANIEARNNNSETALHLAASKGFKSVVETLTAKADVNARDRRQGTPLHRAAGNGHSDLVQLLLSKGADVNASSSAGDTALMVAARAGHVMTVNVLLTAKATADAQDENGRTALSLAAGSGHLDVIKALLAAKADPNAGERDLPLATAVFQKQAEIAEALLGAGADANRACVSSSDLPRPGQPGNRSGVAAFPANVRGSYGPFTPIQIAVSSGDAALARSLLKFKADTNVKDPWNNPPSPLVFSTMGNSEMFKTFLDGGANPDSVNSSEEPLINVAARSGFALTEMLLAHQAKVNVHGYVDATPLHRAVESGDRKTLELLLAHQANPNAKDNQGGTPLHWTVGYGRKEMAEALLAHGADPNIQNKDGRTPLDLTKPQQPGQPGLVASSGIPLRPPRPGFFTAESKASPSEIGELLRAKGALDELPNFSGIRITRGMATPQWVFGRGTSSLNGFTLMDALAVSYVLQPGGFSPLGPQNTMPFPDLKKIRIQRWSGNKPGDKKEIAVNLLTETGSIDCGKDLPLEFGDMIEIPEREHTLAEPSVGLTAEQKNELAKCTERRVKIVVRSETAEIKLTGNNAYLSQALSYREVQNILRSTSDFSRIKVTRTDPATRQTKQFVVQKLSGADDLWLRDGDVIEVPDKP